MGDERFRRFRPFRDFARSRKAETALAARFFSRFRDFDGKSKSADGRIQGHPRRRLFGGLVNATPTTGARFFRDFEIPFSTKTESRNLRAQNFVGARRRSTGNHCFVRICIFAVGRLAPCLFWFSSKDSPSENRFLMATK